MESLFPYGSGSPSGIWKGYIKLMKMFNINLWSCKFLLASNEWQVTMSPAAKDRYLPNKTFLYRVFVICFWWLFCLVSQTCVSHSSTPASLFVSLSVGGRTTCILPLAGKSVVITSTSGHFYGTLNQSADHYFICVVKYNTLSHLLFISEVLSQL